MSTQNPKVELFLLGTPLIIVDGMQRRLPYQKVTALLAYLAVTSRAQSREALATLLWGDVDDRRANSSLRNALYVIRRELEPASPLLVGRQQVSIDSMCVWLDIDRFKRAIREEAENIVSLQEALELWRGAFVDGLFIKGAPDYNDWVSRTRAQLSRYCQEGYMALSEAQGRARRWPAALDAALKAVDLDPLYEGGHRQVMRIHLRMGNRTAALQQYERCRLRLLEELDVLPGARTQALHKQALAGEFEPSRSLLLEKGREKRSVFVGRQRELAALGEHLQAVRRETQGRLVLVEGEAGVGKTRLVNEWLATLRGVHILASRCFEAERSIPYHPWIDLLRISMEHAHWQRLELSDLWLAELTHLIPELRTRYPDLPLPATPDPELTRGRLGEAIHRWLRALGQQGPICLFLDDLQWIDRASLATLEYLLRHSGNLPLLIVGTQREQEADPPWQRTQSLLTREGLCHSMILYRLSFSEVAVIARHIGFNAADPDAFLKRLFRETQGNPLFVVEVLQNLQKLDVDPSGEWPIPPTVRGVIQARLDRLRTPTRQMLTIAAVVGQTFEHTTLHAVTRQPLGQVLSAVDEGIAAGLIADDEGRYEFSHDQIRVVLYGHVSQARRRHLHRRIAEVLEARHKEDLAPYLGLLANHFGAAGEAEPARHYALRAAKRAVELYADDDALGWYDQALALCDIAPAELAPEAISGVIPFQQRYVSAASPLDTLGLVYRQQGLIHQRRGRYDVAQQHFEWALARAAARGRLDEQAAAHSLLSFLGYLRGDYEALTERALRSLELSTEAGESALRAEGLRNLGIAAYRRGDYQQAIDVYRESLAASRSINDRAGMAKCYNNIGFALRTLRRFDEAVVAFEQALELHEATGSIEGAAGVLANIGSVYATSGDLEQALVHLKRAITLCDESHADWVTVKAYRTLGNVYLQTGDCNQALAAGEKARALAEGLGSKEDLGAAYRLLGEIAAACAESGLGSASTYFEKSLALLQEVGEMYELARAMSSLEAYGQMRKAGAQDLEL